MIPGGRLQVEALPVGVADIDLDAPDAGPYQAGPGGVLRIYWHRGAPVGMSWGEAAPPFPSTGPETSDSPVRGAMPSLTIAVCTRNRPEALALCLERLRAVAPGAHQLLVVDNASGDGRTRAVASRFGADCLHEPRVGVTHARNRALAEASGAAVAFIDDDCAPVAGWFDAVSRALAQPGVGACTGPVLPLELATRAQVLMERRGGYCRGFARTLFTESSHASERGTYPLQPWRFGSGANMAFRRDLLAEVGGFDPALPVGEDIDLLFRVVRGGFGLLYDPAAAVRHRHPREYRELRRRLYRWGWAYGAFLTKELLFDAGHRRQAVREWTGVVRHHLGGGVTRWPGRLLAVELAGLAAGIPGYLGRAGLEAVYRKARRDRDR